MMTSRRDLAFVRGVGLSLALLILMTWCGSSRASGPATLTPLTARPEDPDPANIVDQNDLMPSASPDGKHVLFTSRRSGNFRLYVMNTDGSDVRLVSGGPGTQMQGSCSPDGKRIAFVQRQDDHRYLSVMNADGSDPVNLTDAGGGWPIPCWTPDGKRILYHAPGGMGADDIVSIDPAGGKPVLVLGSQKEERHPSPSPDGKWIVFVSRRDGDDFEVYVADLVGGPWTQLTDNDVDDFSPSWSPDGSRIVFQSPRAGRWTILSVKPDGSEETPLTRYPMQWDPVWSSDGREIFFNSERDGRRGIYVMNDDGSNPRKLTNTEPSAFVTLVREDGVDEAVRVLREAREKNEDGVFFYEREVEYLGEKYMEMGDLRKAALLFEVNAEAYPESKDAHVHLGNALLAAGEVGPAAESYERALEIDHDDAVVSRLLERLLKEKP